jgi:HPt (histidine-containing phosphotransfer) domain-containing protein
MDFKSFLKSEIIDLSSIKNFFSDDKELLVELISVFINDTKPKVDILEKNINQLDFSEVQSISHFFKSSFGLMGINCLDEIDQLEKLAIKKENPKLIQDKLSTVIKVTNNSIVEYRAILNKIKTL